MNALAMLERCVVHQPGDAAFASGGELLDCASREPAPPVIRPVYETPSDAGRTDVRRLTPEEQVTIWER